MSKTYLHDTVEILVIGSGRNMFQDLVVNGKNDNNSTVWSEKQSQSTSRKKYFDYIGKFLSQAQHNDKKKPKEKKISNEKIPKNQGLNRITEVGDFQLVSETIYTENMLLNLNFHLIGDFILDPYVTDYISSNITLVILTFQVNDETEFARALQLYNMLHKNNQSSDIKFECQKLILESKLIKSGSNLPAYRQLPRIL